MRRRDQTTTPSELRAEVLDLLLPLQCAASLWSAELRLDCGPDELAAALDGGRLVCTVAEPPDGAGTRYALERYEVEVAGGRVGLRVVSRARTRPLTADERVEVSA